jgi:uridine monophosphate synthetase
MQKQHLLKQLHHLGAIKYGDFTLKSGAKSSIYIDLRVLVSYPETLREISLALWEKVSALKFDHLCGVPYTALPIATCMSIDNKKPMLMRRKEAKSHGTKQLIEGHFQPQQHCLIIEDVITTAGSVMETIKDLADADLKTTAVAVIVDREQGGKQTLEQAGYQVFSLFTLSELTAWGKTA